MNNNTSNNVSIIRNTTDTNALSIDIINNKSTINTSNYDNNATYYALHITQFSYRNSGINILPPER